MNYSEDLDKSQKKIDYQVDEFQKEMDDFKIEYRKKMDEFDRRQKRTDKIRATLDKDIDENRTKLYESENRLKKIHETWKQLEKDEQFWVLDSNGERDVESEMDNFYNRLCWNPEFIKNLPI
jgi:chromosome segregation ATPase